MASNSRHEFAAQLPKIYFLLGALWASVSALILISIPGDPKNAWILGFSKTRLGLLILMSGASIILLALALKSWRNPAWSQSLVDKLDHIASDFGYFSPLMILAFGLFVLGPYIYLLIKHPLEGFNLRVFPLILFLTLITIQTLIVLVIFVRMNRAESNLEENDQRTIMITPDKLSIMLVLVTLFFIITSLSNNIIEYAGYAPELSRYTNKLDLDVESNIPTFFSSVLLFSAGVLFGIIAWLRQGTANRYLWAWSLLAGIFIYLAIDESTKLHELLTLPLRSMFNTGGFLTYAWVIAAIPILVILGIIFLPFFINLPTKTKRMFFVAAILYIGGAVGMEIIGAGYIGQAGIDSVGYIVLSTIEESLEITGIIILIHALLDYIKGEFTGQQIILA